MPRRSTAAARRSARPAPTPSTPLTSTARTLGCIQSGPPNAAPAHLKLTARGRAGHGSRRNDENAVVRLIAVVVPYCMGGRTDAKAFAPLWAPKGFPYRAMAHGVDERVPVDGIRFGARVLQHFLTHC